MQGLAQPVQAVHVSERLQGVSRNQDELFLRKFRLFLRELPRNKTSDEGEGDSDVLAVGVLLVALEQDSDGLEFDLGLLELLALLLYECAFEGEPLLQQFEFLALASLLPLALLVPLVAHDLASVLAEHSQRDQHVEGVVDPALDVLLFLVLTLELVFVEFLHQFRSYLFVGRVLQFLHDFVGTLRQFPQTFLSGTAFLACADGLELGFPTRCVHFCLFVVLVVGLFGSDGGDGVVLFVLAENQSLFYDLVFVVLLREEAGNDEVILFVVGIVDEFGPGREFLVGLVEADEGEGLWGVEFALGPGVFFQLVLALGSCLVQVVEVGGLGEGGFEPV